MVVRLTWSRSKYSFIFVAHMVARSAHMVTRSFLTKMSCIHGKVRRFRAYKRKIEKNSNESTSVCIIALYLCNKKLIFCFLIKPESRRHRATPKNTLVFLVYSNKYHISDMIPVALPPRVASDGLQDPCSYFV